MTINTTLSPKFLSESRMTDYALKAFKNGRISYDDVLVLPRAQSELPDH
jgi:hypothetical protein